MTAAVIVGMAFAWFVAMLLLVVATLALIHFVRRRRTFREIRSETNEVKARRYGRHAAKPAADDRARD